MLGKTDKGFTLIELMMVVIIIGVLAAMIAPRLSGRTEKAKRSAAKSDMQSIGLALKMYELDMGNYPSNAEGLNALIIKPTGEMQSANWDGPYLEKQPIDPWAHPYGYEYPSDKSLVGYAISSVGKDGIESEDDITNWEKKS